MVARVDAERDHERVAPVATCRLDEAIDSASQTSAPGPAAQFDHRRAQELDEAVVADGEEGIVGVRLGVDDASATSSSTARIRCAGRELVRVDRDADPRRPSRCMHRQCASLHVTGIDSAMASYPTKRYSAATSAVRYAAGGLPAGVKSSSDD